MTRGLAPLLLRGLDRPDEGNALHQVERAHHQVLLRLGAHGHQVVVAQVAIDERQQVALGMFVVELLDDLDRQFLRQPVVEARTGGQALQAAVLDVLGDQRPRGGR
ncbi:MAG: hypothetical protein V9E93_00750 [Steroidobacteraceae bacterium]